MPSSVVPIQVRRLLGFDESVPDREILEVWKQASARVCKPCWELKYCPYGPLVEDFPLLPPTRDAAIQHQDYPCTCLNTGVLADGAALDADRRLLFERMVADFDPDEYPEQIPKPIADMRCGIFGHLCPVAFVAEPFTETSESRRTGRYIPFTTKLRVVRRDNSQCQVCGRTLREYEYEFDHRIPDARGGSAEEHNIRLTCLDCNRRKGKNVEL